MIYREWKIILIIFIFVYYYNRRRTKMKKKKVIIKYYFELKVYTKATSVINKESIKKIEINTQQIFCIFKS